MLKYNQDVDDISSTLSSTTLDGAQSVGTHSYSSRPSASTNSSPSIDPSRNGKYKYDKEATAQLLKAGACPLARPTPMFHLGTDGIEVVRDGSSYPEGTMRS